MRICRERSRERWGPDGDSCCTSADHSRCAHSERVDPCSRDGGDDHHPLRARLRDAWRCCPAPLPYVSERDLRARHWNPRPHLGDAPRVRRGPHRGDRQHDPQAFERRQAATKRWILFLSRALDDRVRHGGALELRHPRPGRTGEEQRFGAPQHHEHRRNGSLGLLPLHHRGTERRHPRLDPPRLHGSPSGQVQRRRARRAAAKARADEPFLGPLARRIDTPWKMYPIGVLFGLGFDTATEVALLVLSGTAVASGLPSTPSCRFQFCSRQACACSTRWTGVS